MASKASALSLINDKLIQEEECTSNCTLNTFISLGVNLSEIILGVVGALTLAMFIYGGVKLILSGGSSEKVTEGKNIILGSVVGLLIVFGSYSIINFVINDVFEAKVNNDGTLQNAFTGEAPKDTMQVQIGDVCKNNGGECQSSCAGATVKVKDCRLGQVCCMPTVTSCNEAQGFRCSEPAHTLPLCSGSVTSGCYECEVPSCTQGTGLVSHCCRFISIFSGT